MSKRQLTPSHPDLFYSIKCLNIFSSHPIFSSYYLQKNISECIYLYIENEIYIFTYIYIYTFYFPFFFILQYLIFKNKPMMHSFVSLLDGYYRLSEKWTFNLCKDLSTPSLVLLRSMKCHGPVGYDFYCYHYYIV